MPPRTNRMGTATCPKHLLALNGMPEVSQTALEEYYTGADIGRSMNDDVRAGFAPSMVTDAIDSNIEEPLDRYRSRILLELGRGFEEASTFNWDGYGAAPASQAAFAAAIRFILLMPNFGIVPEVYADTEGDIRMEWYREWCGTLILNVSGDRAVKFACSIENGDFRGSVIFGDEFPADIGYFIWKITTNAD